MLFTAIDKSARADCLRAWLIFAYLHNSVIVDYIYNCMLTYKQLS